MSTALETHLGGRKSGRETQERTVRKTVGRTLTLPPSPDNSPFGLAASER